MQESLYQVQEFIDDLFGVVRGFIDQYNNLWFMGSDVARALGYSNTRDALMNHVDPEDRWGSRFTTPTENINDIDPKRWGGRFTPSTENINNTRYRNDTPSEMIHPITPTITFIDSIGRTQTQTPVWINESGLYSLIFSSKLPAAKQFKHWVTSVILPMMRKIGFDRSEYLLENEISRLQQELINKDRDISKLTGDYSVSKMNLQYQLKSITYGLIKNQRIPDDEIIEILTDDPIYNLGIDNVDTIIAKFLERNAEKYYGEK